MAGGTGRRGHRGLAPAAGSGVSRRGAVYLGVDLGTTYCKVVALDASGRKVSAERIVTPWKRAGGVTFLEAAELGGRVRKSIELLLDALGEVPVAGLEATSMGESGVLLDRRGEVVAPVLAWFDTFAKAELAELERLVGAAAFAERTGVPLDATRSAVKYAWLRRNVPEARNGVRWLSLAEWLIHTLGARAITEASLGARTGFLDLRTGAPYQDVWRWTDAPPDLLTPPAPAGLDFGRARTGRLDGAVLTVAGHDHQAAARGVGATTTREVVVSSGTSITVVRRHQTIGDEELRRVTRRRYTVGPDLRREGLSLQKGFMGGRLLDRLAARLGLRYDTDAYRTCDARAAERIAGVVSSDAEPLVEAWSSAMRGTWRKVEAIAHEAGERAGDETYIVCGGWTRSRAFRAAGEHGTLSPIEVRDVSDAGATGAALLALEAATRP